MTTPSYYSIYDNSVGNLLPLRRENLPHLMSVYCDYGILGATACP